MLKKSQLIIIFIFALFAFGITASALDVYVDGEKVEFNDDLGYPYIENDRTMLPLRAVAEACGAEVWWDSEYSTACAKKNEVTVYCTVGDKNIYRNNTRIENDVAATIKNGRVYLPIRAVLEAFDAKVEWDGNVIVTCDGDKAFINGIENSGTKTDYLWSEWQKALDLKNSGSYHQAIDALRDIASAYLKESGFVNRALFYNELAQCYAQTGEYNKAAACFDREAENWTLAGKSQEAVSAQRKSKATRTTVQIYAKTEHESFKTRRNFGELYEPENGLYNGVYAERDEKVNDPSSMKKFYMNEFPKMVGKEMASYLLYMNDGVNFSHYKSHFTVAKEKDKIMQIALEPTNILNIKKDDSRYINFAKEISQSGVRVFIRFACEMNEKSIPWYTDGETYKEKFRYVADIFHKYAPAAVMVWSPNFHPEDNYEDYYPGDAYVDYVGVSSYMVQKPETDPLEEGVDRTRWSSQLDTIYSLYGYKKPIIISECGVAHENYTTGKDITEFAVEQLSDFYTYIPIRYPNIKAIYYFDNDGDTLKYKLSRKSEFLNTYKKAIKNELYLSDPDHDEDLHQYYELGNNVNVYPEETEICSYFTTGMEDISYVVYYVNSNRAGVAYGIPYAVDIDFSDYSGQVVELKAAAYNTAGKKIAEKAYDVKVWSFSGDVPDNIYADKNEDVKVIINGKTVSLDGNPTTYGDSVMVPIGEIAENLGYDVTYDSKNHKITAVKGDRKVYVNAGDRNISVNNVKQSMDAAPIEIKNDFLVSVDGVDLGLRCDYEWNGSQKRVSIEERESVWSEWDEDLPSNIDKKLYYIEEETEYRYRTREKEYFTLSRKMSAVNFVKEVTSYGEWSSWQTNYIASSDKLEVKTRTVSDGAIRYRYGHYCTGNVGDPDKNYRTASYNWCDEAKFHELGWYNYKLDTSSPGSDDTILYDSEGNKKRCSNTCFRWYVIETEGGEHTEYSCRDIIKEYVYWEWGNWSRWSSWDDEEPDYYYSRDEEMDVDERTYYRYREK